MLDKVYNFSPSLLEFVYLSGEQPGIFGGNLPDRGWLQLVIQNQLYHQMNKNIINKMTSEHYLWGDKCDSWVFVDTIGLSVKQESMPAGTQEKIHFHRKSQQFFFILKGTATFYAEDKKIQVAEQEGLSIEPETKHFIANETNEKLEFLVISQPSSNDDRILIE